MLVSILYNPNMDRLLTSRTEALVPLLAAFDVVAGQGSVTNAAKNLGVPQSSLSRRLKTVEQVLGLSLFQPAGRQLALTPQGRDLYEQTHQLVLALNEAIEAVRSNADPESGLVRFGFPLSLGPVSIPSLLADFHRRAPGIRLHLVQAHGLALVDQMNDGSLDLAVMIPAPTDIPSTLLGYQRISLYVARDHPLSQSQRVDIADLKDETFIANPPSFHLRKVLNLWCAEAGFTPRVPFEITEFDTLRGLVETGLGIALLPDAETSQSRLKKVDVYGPRHRSIALACSARASPAVLRLRNHIIEEAALITDDVDGRQPP